MRKSTNEDNKILEEKIKNVHLNLKKIPEIFEIESKIKYKPLKDYDNSYKVYEFVNVKDIDIYITKGTSLDEVEKKYKNAIPISEYIKTGKEQNEELHLEFEKMLEKLDLYRLEMMEEEQQKFQNHMPYEVRYNDNFIWNIYYSDVENKYFMLFSSEEERVEGLFYLIKKKIEVIKKKKEEIIYVPISGKQPNYKIIKKSECVDLENYLWFFTGEWPNIYEVYDKDENATIQILGTMPVYNEINSLYKISLNTKEEAQEFFKLVKALFILQSSMEQEYQFKTGLGNDGKIDFYYNHNQITYEKLPDFIKNEVYQKYDKINKQISLNIIEKENLQLIKKAIENKNLEYLNKEKQIVMFLECKKTFFGRITYFFKKKKNKNKDQIPANNIEKNSTNNNEEKIEKYNLEDKKIYTIEDLLEVGAFLEEKEKEYKNLQMDIKALEFKKKNLESKIKNATLYINEIESHKKSIFDFWKFTNKDEVKGLEAGEEVEKEEIHQKIKRSFSIENDLEDLSEQVDNIQRKTLDNVETDAIFAIYNNIKSFNLISKGKLLRKDEKEIESILEDIQEDYKKDYEKIKEKDFDIFGSVVEDKTKIKVLKNNKHREIEKDKYRILNVNMDTTTEEYIEIISNYKKILDGAIDKIKSPCELPIYKISNDLIENEKYAIFDINPAKEVLKINNEDENIILNRINVKENMPIVFYSNIMFYDNKNQTLPVGMDLSTETLMKLDEYNLKLVSRKDFKLNILKNKFESSIKNIQVYEYDVELKEEK